MPDKKSQTWAQTRVCPPLETTSYRPPSQTADSQRPTYRTGGRAAPSWAQPPRQLIARCAAQLRHSSGQLPARGILRSVSDARCVQRCGSLGQSQSTWSSRPKKMCFDYRIHFFSQKKAWLKYLVNNFNVKLLPDPTTWCCRAWDLREHTPSDW